MNEQEFYRAMTARYSALSGFVPDEASDIALRFHALAGELADFSARLDEAARQSDPLTAKGEALDALAALRGISRRPAAPAAADLTFTRAPGTAGEVPIPAGTACAAPDGRVYLTTDAGSIPAGETSATLAARAALAGRGGNAAAGSVTLPRRLAAGVAAVENGAPFAGGTDAEGDDSLRRRLLAAWARPANGVNGESYRAAAEAWPGIGSAAVCAGERPGSLTVYAAADGAPAVPEAVLAGLSEALGGMRAPCDTVTVESAEAVAAGVSIEIEAPAECFSEVREALLGRVRETLDRMPVGAGLPVARLCALAMDREEVTNCRVLLPAADLAAGPAQVLRAGELSVTRMGG